jgi:hypothetical protein
VRFQKKSIFNPLYYRRFERGAQILNVDSLLAFKILSPKEKLNGLSVSCNNVDTNFDFERLQPNFLWEPQEAFISELQHFV